MIFLVPIGRKNTLTKFPWMTLALIIGSCYFFSLSWPDEKKFQMSRSVLSQLVYTADSLLEVVMDPLSGLSNEKKILLERERRKYGYPSLAVNKVFEEFDHNSIDLSLEQSEEWNNAYLKYGKIMKKAEDIGVPEASLFLKYGMTSDGQKFPSLLTYQFLHSGFLHLFFNMLFLWIVGCNIEERWGPPIFLFLFISGGVVAAMTQLTLHSFPGIPMVGASGSVAAIMGAFLIRHYKMPIKLLFSFLFFWNRIFYIPAWIVLPLWFAKQILMGMMTIHSGSASVGYWAHAGGFLYGVLAGFVIRRGNLGENWERAADSTKKALEMKYEKGINIFREGNISEARNIFEEILKVDPHHLRALEGLLGVCESLNRKEDCGRIAIQLIRTTILSDQKGRADNLFFQYKEAIQNSNPSSADGISLAQSLEKLNLWSDALSAYQCVIQKDGGSPLAGRALFSAGKILKNRLKNPEEAKSCFKPLMESPYDMEWRALAKSELRGLEGR